MSRPGAVQRLAQTRRLLQSEGAADVAARVRSRAAKLLAPPGIDRLPVSREDLLRVAEIQSAGRGFPAPLPAAPGEPLTIAWVCTPTRAGSGGHTTMFRIISLLEKAGHTCIVYLHDRHAWSLDQHRTTIRRHWPHVAAEIRDVAAGIEDCHAIFATAWMTTYPVLASPARGARMYFVQDFEPSFVPAGSESLLAEATYRFGFHGVTAGRWLAQMLQRDYGMAADPFDFGCDLDRYGLEPQAGERNGVSYYCRPSTPRRAFGLAVLALELFAAQHPEVPIHFFGEPAGRLSFEVTEHGMLDPSQLSTLYNRCIAGLSLSATNVSLVPHEMLAAGCIPVVNDAEHNRIVLDNPEVAYAQPTPVDLAAALSQLLTRPAAEREAKARTAAASVTGTSWEDAGAAVARIVIRVVNAASKQEITV